jgi:serine/threonine protein kinase
MSERKKISIHADYKSLDFFVKSIDEQFESGGTCIYKGRNEIRVFEHEGLLLNVKRFRTPHIVNRVAYSFFRKSKAARAYENSLRLKELHIEVPLPMAYVECFHFGLLNASYYVSQQCTYPRTLREFRATELGDRSQIAEALGLFIAHLHDSGVLHKDLSIGNVLFEERDGRLSFCLVDLNRMRFEPIDMKKGCKNMERLRGDRDFIRIMTSAYARARGFDEQSCFNAVYKHISDNDLHFQRKGRRKKALRLWHLIR